MTVAAFYERRRETKPAPFPNDRRLNHRRNQVQSVSEERRRLISQVRRYERDTFKIPVRLKVQDREISGYTHNVSPEGLLVLTDAVLKSAAPVDLQFSFGEDICFLNVTGQVVFCRLSENGRSPRQAIGIKFPAIRKFEQTILASAAQELKQGAITEGESLLTIIAASNVLAQGTANASNETLQESEGRHAAVRPEASVSDPVSFWAPVRDKLLGFPLLIDGQDLDTGVYEFLPIADKMIAEYQKTAEVVSALKRGQFPVGFDKYVYAFLSIGDSKENSSCLRSAFHASTEFRRFSISRRRKILEDIFELLVQNEQRILELLVLEGHPVKLAEWEFSGMKKIFCADSLEYFRRMLFKKIGTDGSESLFLARKPDGVVGVIPPGNAACSNSIIAVGALLAGNALVIKPPLKSAGATMFLWRNVISEALMLNGAPSGTVNLIIGDSKKLIAEWMDSPYLNDIFFFGESALGLEIGAQAFAKGKKPILELSGNDMLIVWRDANLMQAAESLLDSFLGSTQICMVPKKALIHGDVYEEFERIFIDKVRSLIVSLPSDPSTYLAPVLRSERFFEFLDDALINGARLLCGGERIDHEGNNRKHGMYIAPTVIRVDEETANALKCIREENFFPLIPLVRINTDATFRDEHVFQRMMSFIEANHYGLRISVWANSPRYIRKFVANVDNCGLLRINSRHVGFSSLLGTHGGTRFSGGPYGEMNYVWEKTSHLQGISYTKERNGKGNPWMKS